MNASPDISNIPKYSDVKNKWPKFRSASRPLPSFFDADEKPDISILRVSEHCIEITSDTLQRSDFTINLHMIAAIMFGFSLIPLVALNEGDAFFSIWVLFPVLIISYLIALFLLRTTNQRYLFRRSRVRFDRQNQKVFYANQPGRGVTLSIEWGSLLAIDFYRGKGQGYLYLFGYSLEGSDSELVKIPVIGPYTGHSNASTWAWLQGYMTGEVNLPAPTIESPPQTWREVLLQSGGQWVIESFTDPQRRRWLPLTIWIDLSIVLFIMPMMALPQLIILTYPEAQFSPENDRLCGFDHQVIADVFSKNENS